MKINVPIEFADWNWLCRLNVNIYNLSYFAPFWIFAHSYILMISIAMPLYSVIEFKSLITNYKSMIKFKYDAHVSNEHTHEH